MERDKGHTRYPELELGLKLSQLEGCFKFLTHMNIDLIDAPRNVTEQETVKRNLKRVQECRELYREILKTHVNIQQPVHGVQIAKGTLTTKTI